MSSSERTDPLGLAGARLLDRYVVEQAIAQGGMAVIYRGRDLRLLRPVCIKVFHRLQRSEASYRTAYEHFVQEAFALSQFLHPNTLRIFDFGYLDGDGRSPGDGGAPFQISELLLQLRADLGVVALLEPGCYRSGTHSSPPVRFDTRVFVPSEPTL